MSKEEGLNDKTKRIVLFLIALALLFVVFKIATGNFKPQSDTFVIIFSSLVMLSFVTLFLEHFFTKPTDVLASTISILLLLSPLRNELSKLGIWFEIFYVYNLCLLLSALIALLLLEKTKPSTSLQNKLSLHLKRFAVFLGNGRFLYSCLFFLTLLFYVDSQSKPFLWLFSYAAIIILINPKKLIRLTFFKKAMVNGNEIGEIFSVQSKNTFLVKLYKERTSIQRFDCVEFNYAIGGRQHKHKGVIRDIYNLNEEQWANIMSCKELACRSTEQSPNGSLSDNVVYRISDCKNDDFKTRFVGVVIEYSEIEKIRFEYSDKVPVLQGNLLQIQINGTTVLYQIIQGLTDIEKLESKNEAGIIVGEAIQLGVWDSGRRTFDKYGWVPSMNSPIFSAHNIEVCESVEGEYEIGSIPKTNFPILMNVNDAIKHHIAILGITGSGKSVFARKLIKDVIGRGTKVICVDFTNEYKLKFPEVPNIIREDKLEGETESQADRIFSHIDWISEELGKFSNQQDHPGIKRRKQAIQDEFLRAIKAYLTGEPNLILFELPDVSNTTGILEYTRWFFKVLFDVAKEHKNFGKRICVVIEEAHTVIPEWNFIGASDKHAGSLVNCISQIALQGRKYNVGFIVIAQRTANVSKTVLTQCNTIIAFQQFDKTSSEFLSNYIGTEMAKTLPKLGLYQAIAVGKGFRTGIPLICQVPTIIESDSAETADDTLTEDAEDLITDDDDISDETKVSGTKSSKNN